MLDSVYQMTLNLALLGIKHIFIIFLEFYSPIYKLVVCLI